MMFYMNSKVFEKYFLANERDQDILDAQYVLISCRIRVSSDKYDNILNAKNDLFPDPMVCNALDDDTFRERYFEQLEQNKALIAYLIKGSIEEKFNIIFLCTKNEYKVGYMQYLSEYVLMEFGYPIYEYKKYSKNMTTDVDIDIKTTINFCNRVVEEAKQKSLDYVKDEEIHKDIKQLSKDALKKELKRRGLYKKGMDKYTMKELLEFDII